MVLLAGSLIGNWVGELEKPDASLQALRKSVVTLASVVSNSAPWIRVCSWTHSLTRLHASPEKGPDPWIALQSHWHQNFYTEFSTVHPVSLMEADLGH